MESDEEETDLYDELIERNRLHIVKVISPKWFYDPLRTESILTQTDCEEVEGNRTRWQKAGSLLDILRTKGNNGVQKFLGILEFEHPECFKKITKKDPREPPPGYCSAAHERESQFLTMIDRLPQIAKELTKDYLEKKDLTNELKKMTDLLQLAHTEKQDMERDNEYLRCSMNQLKHKVSSLEKNLAVSLRQVEKLKDESMEYLKNSLQMRDERDNFRDRWQAAQMEKDEQERQNRNLKEQFSTVKDELAKSKRESAAILQTRAVGETEEVPRTVLRTQSESQNSIQQGMMITREQILREERDEIREKCEELSQDLEKYRQESEDYHRKYTQEKEKARRLRNANDQLEKEKNEIKEMRDGFYNDILKLELEKQNIEKEKHKEQQKTVAESEKRRQLFVEKHELEKRYETLKAELEKLKVDYRNSRFSASDLPETDLRHSTVTSSDSEGDHERGRVHNIKSSVCEQCVLGYQYKHSEGSLPFNYDLNMDPFEESFEEYYEMQFESSQNSFGQKSSTMPKSLERDCHRPVPPPRKTQNHKWHHPSNLEIIKTKITRKGQMARSPTIDPQVGWSFKDPQSRINDVDDPFRDRVDTRLLPLKTQNCDETTDNSQTFVKKESLIPITSSASETSEDSNVVEFMDLISNEVLTDQLPPTIIGLNDVHLESQCFNIIITTPIFGEKFDVTGGNFTGIYVSKLYKNIGKMNVGDQILKIVFHNSENPLDKLTRDLRGYTQEDIKKLLDRPPGTEIEMHIKQDALNYDLVKKWMDNNHSQGDSFFVKSNIKCDLTKKIPRSLAVNNGNIFHVVNTTPVNQNKYWQAFKYNHTTGQWSDTPGFIPNGKEAKKFQRGWSHEDSIQTQRNKAFRYRILPYVKVLPTRAKSRMPVLLFGKEELVEAVRDLMVHESEEFSGHNPVKDGQEEIRYILQQDRHLVFKNPAYRSYPSQNISLCVGIEKETCDVLKKLFDKTFDCSDSIQLCKSASEKLEQQAVMYNVVTINCAVTKNKQSLLQQLKQTITCLQERIVWLSEKHLEPMAVDTYSVMLMSDKHAQFSNMFEKDTYVSVESYTQD